MQVVGRVIRFLYLVAIARFLDANDVGLFSYGMAFYLSLLGLGLFGQETLLATRVGRRRARFPVTAAHSLTILVAALAAVTAFGLGFLRLTEPDPAVGRVLAFFLLALIARGFAGWVRGCYVALERATWIPRYEFTFRGLEAVTGIAALALGGGLLAISFLHFSFWALEAAASFRLLVRQTGFRLRLGGHWRLLKAYALASLPVTLGLWLIGVFPQAGIVGLRQIQPGAAEVAYFAIAMQFVTTLLVVPVSLAQAILPGLARAHRNRSRTDLLALVTVLKACLVGGALAAAVTAALGPWIVTALFGGRYLAAGDALARLMWGVGPYAATFIAVTALNGLGVRGRAAFAAFAMVAIQGGGMVLLAGPGGMDAVDATVAAFLLAALAGMALSFAGLTAALDLGSEFGGGFGGWGWWLAPTGVLLAGAGLGLGGGLGGWLAPAWVMIAGAALTLAGTVALRVFSRQEIAVVLAKTGLRSGALVRWLEREPPR